MSFGSDLHLQQTACQDLLAKDGACSGWLRGKTALHKLGEAVDQKINKPGFAHNITSMISWQRFYVIVSDGYLLIYKSETSKKPDKVIDLCGFQRAEKEEYLKVKDVPWPFKVTCDINNKVMYYGAMSEPELKKWIEAVTKGIDDAKQSGRQPVIYEKKETIPKPAKKQDKPLPKAPSIHSNYSDDDEDDDDLQDDYDYIADPIEEMQQNAKPPASSRMQLPPLPGRGGEVEYELTQPKPLHPTVEPKLSVKPRKDIPVPPSPVDKFEAVTANLKKTLQVHAPAAVPAPEVKQQPQKKPPAVPKPVANVKPAITAKNDTQPNLVKKPVPKVPPGKPSSPSTATVAPMPVGRSSHEAVEDECEYEMTEDNIVVEATWKGTSEESTALMRSVKEEGIFMIRESTTGNGDITLQVFSDDVVRKYKIAKEGKKYQMAGGSIFDSMAELLTFYQTNNLPNRATKLTKPYSKL